MPEHTPGPWRAVDLYPEQSGLEIDILGHPDYRFGGEYIVCKVNSILTPPSTTTANAALIAAAPEMLQALRNIIGHNNALKPMHRLPNSLVREIQTAIAKATGESEG